MRLTMTLLTRISGLVATSALVPGIVNPQCDRPIPSRCAVMGQARSAFRLAYDPQRPLRRTNRTSQTALWFRFTNNSACDVYLATLEPYGSGTNRGLPIRTPRDRERIPVVYVIDNDWGWGHSFGAFNIKSGRSILVAIPRDELLGGSTLWIPVAFDLETPFTSLDISRACFELDQLPRSVVKQLAAKRSIHGTRVN